MENLSEKVAFVTGGASGIGLAMVRSFTNVGMKVVVADIEDKALEAVAEDATLAKAGVHTMHVDVTNRQEMAAAADETEKIFGNIHVVCNNAGVVLFGALADMKYEDWDWLMNVNLQGVVNGLHTFLPRIQRHGEGGHIVNTASFAGISSLPGLGVYSATKWAVVAISEILRKELDGSGIGVSVLCPGGVRTNIGSSGRNRPKALQAEEGPARGALSPSLGAALSDTLDPAIVGEMVFAAIEANDGYIFTHPDWESMSNERFDAMKESFARWRRYREARGV
jgi:NADP-dependent 3-hydroxy acid dehydrogenase YdfG